MSLIEKINADIKTAMLAQDKRKLEALRAVKAAMLLVVTGKDGGEVNESIEIQTLQRLIKQRHEAADMYAAAGRSELAEEERFQAAVIQTYLPPQVSEEEVVTVIKAIIEKSGVSDIKGMGTVMGLASKELAGKTDNKLISNVVKTLLTTP
jgi:uncharacterized protein YqeY